MPQVKFLRELKTSPNNKHFKGKSFNEGDVTEVSQAVADALEKSKHVMVLKMDPDPDPELEPELEADVKPDAEKAPKKPRKPRKPKTSE